MYKVCHTEQSSRRQQEIAGVFLRLLQDTPVARLRISDLCREAGISRKVFYRYFDGKEDVFRFLLDNLYGEARLHLRAITLWPFQARRKDCVDLFRFWARRQELLNVLLEDAHTELTQDSQLRYFLLERLEPGDGAEDWTKTGATRFLVSGLFGLLRYWRSSGYRQTPEELGELLYRLMGGEA